MGTSRTTRRIRRAGERGMAMVIVMAGSLAALALVLASTTLTLGSITSSRHAEAVVAAESAADAGVEDFIYRLNRDSNYWRYAWTDPATGVQGPLPPGQSNDALTAAGKLLPGGGTTERYRYSVVEPPTATNQGRMTLRVVGTSRNSTRTVLATLGRSGFLDYMYFTDYETSDPVNYGTTLPYDSAWAEANCKIYKWQQVLAGATRSSNCREIYFSGADVIDGPVHTNDTLKTNSSRAMYPRFLGKVTTANPTAPYYEMLPRTNTPSFVGGIENAPAVQMPPSNSALRADALAAGCVYTGPTRIWLASTGKMRVTSPLTRSSGPGCGPASGDLDLPANGVIYVQGVPADPTDPNSSTFCNPTKKTPTPYPALNRSGAQFDPAISLAADVTPYSCTDGDVFVQGTLKGQLTIGAQNRVVITNNLVYSDSVAPSYNVVPPSSLNVLGLIPNNNVEIYHPVDGFGRSLTGTVYDAKINAAMLSLQHSITVQNFYYGGALGTLTIHGAMAQRFRGAVGTTAPTGYDKNYSYDSRLKILSPPHFIDPSAAGWSVKTWAEVPNGG